jgi:hypothetical protein
LVAIYRKLLELSVDIFERSFFFLSFFLSQEKIRINFFVLREEEDLGGFCEG